MAHVHDTWKRIEAFAQLCRDVGAFGYGPGWEDRVAELLEQVPLDSLLAMLAECSAQGDQDKVDTMCLVLKYALRSPKTSSAIVNEKFLPALQGGLLHYSPKVRALTAHQIASIGLVSFTAIGPDKFTELVNSVAARLFDNETGVAADVGNALVALANSSSQERTQALASLANTLAQNGGSSSNDESHCEESVAQVRIMSVMARISARDNDALSQAKDLGLVQMLLEMITGDDILLQLNVLRLVPLLSATSAGLTMLADSGIIQQFARMAGLGSDGAFNPDPLLGDEALRVVSQLSARTLASGAPDSARDLSELFLQAMQKKLAHLESISGASSIEIISALELMGAFIGAQPPSSLQLVLDRPAVFEPWIALAASQTSEKVAIAGLGSIADALRGGTVPVKGFDLGDDAILTYMSSDGGEFAHLLAQSRVKPTPRDRAAAAELGKKVLLAFGNKLNERIRALNVPVLTSPTDSVNVIVQLLDKPFDELKCAAYAVLRSVAAQDATWGLQAIYAAGCHVEQKLMDRSLSMNKQSKEWRFAVLEAVFENPHRDSVLGEQRQTLLKNFLRRGAYVGPASAPAPQVMLEGGAA